MLCLVKGGKLAQIPDEAQLCYDSLGGGSNASYALRFAAGFEDMVLTVGKMYSVVKGAQYNT